MATSAVQMNGRIGEWLRKTVGVRQGCLLSPTLFNIFLNWIMSDALEEHDGKVSIGGRNITNLQFASDIAHTEIKYKKGTIFCTFSVPFMYLLIESTKKVYLLCTRVIT